MCGVVGEPKSERLGVHLRKKYIVRWSNDEWKVVKTYSAELCAWCARCARCVCVGVGGDRQSESSARS